VTGREIALWLAVVLGTVVLALAMIVLVALDIALGGAVG